MEPFKLEPQRDPIPIAGGVPTLESGENFLPQQGQEIGYVEAARRGVQENHIVPLVTEAPKSIDDPNFWWDADKIKQYTGELKDPVLANYVLEAASDQEATQRLQIAMSRQETVRKLGEAGWDKSAAYIISSILDPTEIAATTALTMGLGTIPSRVAAAYKGYKTVDNIRDAEHARRAARVMDRAKVGAVEGGTSALVFEGLRSMYQPDADASNLPLFVAFGASLGAATDGVAAAVARSKMLAAYQKRTASGVPLLPEEEVLFKDIIQEQSLATALRNLDSTPTGGMGGAAEKFDANDLGRYDSAPEQRGWGMFGVRKTISAVANAMSSEFGAIRTLSQKLGLNSAGNTDGSPVPVGAIEYQSWAQASSAARFLTKMQPLRDQWVKDTYGSILNPMKRQEAEGEFNRLVTKAIRRPEGSFDPRVQASADALRGEFDYFFKEAKANKARGFMDRGAEAGYAPRIFDEVNIDKLIRQHGRDNIVNLVRKAILAKQMDIDEAIADEIADGYVRGIEKRIAGVGRDGLVVRSGVREDTLDDIREALLQKYNGDEAKVDEIIAAFDRTIKPRERGEGVARSRARIDLDETVSIDLMDGSKIDFEDLLMNDAEDLHTMYTFQVGGAIGLARNGLEQEGMESIEKIMDKIRQEAYARGLSREKIDSQLSSLKFMYDGLTGQLAHSGQLGEGAERALRRIREYNFITTMGSSGLASMVETMNVLFDHNVRTIIKGVPRLRSMIKKMQAGQLEDDLFRELQQFTGTGIDMITGRMRTGFDVNETEFLKSDYTRLDATLAYGRNKTAVLSGMLPLTAMMRRADSMFYAMDWHNAAMKMAKSGNYKSPFARIKMEQLGIDNETGALISKMINKHAVVDSNGKLKTLNLKQWEADGADGKKAFDAFSQSAYRHATQSVQETNLGSVNRFMRSPLGKTVFQFLSFVLGSQEQQLQRLMVRARHGDAGVVGLMTAMSAMMATLVYISRTYLSEEGKSPEIRQKNLEKKLEPTAIARDGTFGYLGVTSLFGTAIQRINGNNLISNPTLDVFGKLTSLGKQAALGEKEASEQQIRQWLRFLPFQNTYPMIVINNQLAKEIAD